MYDEITDIKLEGSELHQKRMRDIFSRISVV